MGSTSASRLPADWTACRAAGVAVLMPPVVVRKVGAWCCVARRDLHFEPPAVVWTFAEAARVAGELADRITQDRRGGVGWNATLSTNCPPSVGDGLPSAARASVSSVVR